MDLEVDLTGFGARECWGRRADPLSKWLLSQPCVEERELRNEFRVTPHFERRALSSESQAIEGLCA